MLNAVRRQLDKAPRLKSAARKVLYFGKARVRRWEGERIIRRGFREFYGRDLNVEQPQGFSEKLFRRMVLMNRSLSNEYSPLVDKYLARDYVARVVGERYLTRLYWHGADPAHIPFDRLPQRYVIKTNHGSGQVIVVNGELDRAATIEKLGSWLRHNYYWTAREHQYFSIRPQVLVEELLDDGWADGPLDYRFWCFAREVAIIQVTNHRNDIDPFYDPDWNRLDIHARDRANPIDIPMPENLAEMHDVAVALAADFDFVRVDLYNVNGRVCFGELTFTPRAGRFKLAPLEWDARLGEKWVLRE